MGAAGSEGGKSPGFLALWRSAGGGCRGQAGGLASGLTGLWVQAPHCSSVPGRLLAAVPDLSWWVLVALRPWPWGEPSQRLHWGRKPNQTY